MDHDPIEDIVLNDQNPADDYNPEHDCYDDPWGYVKMLAWYEREHAPMEEAADAYYEELDRLEDVVNSSVHDPIANILHSIKVAEYYGCHMDKSFAYEGFSA